MNYLLFDLSQTQPEGNVKIHGGGEYGKEMLRFLINQGLYKQVNLLVVLFENKWIDEDLLQNVREHSHQVISIRDISEYKKIIRDFDDPRNLFIFPLPDLIFIANDLEIRKAKVLAAIHGFRFMELVSDKFEYVYYGGHMKKILRWLLKHHVLNDYTRTRSKNKYEKILHSFKSKDVTIILGSLFSINSYKLCFRNLPHRMKMLFPIVRSFEPKKTSAPPYPYLLTIGASRWYKNLWRVLDSLNHFDIFRRFFPSYKYVITSLDDTLQKRIRNNFPNIREFLDVRGFTSTDEKLSLYQNATLFIYPSLNEGFGIPPVEAMSFGTPILASAITSIPEICSDAAEYMNAYNRTDIANKIIYLLEDENRRRELSARGLRRFQEMEKITQAQYADLLSEIRDFFSVHSGDRKEQLPYHDPHSGRENP